MAGDEAIRILTGLWADEGDRVLPDSSSLDVPLSRSIGFPASFGAEDGNQFPRRGWNQRFREWQGAARDALRYGVNPYDPEIDYPATGTCAVGKKIYYAAETNGPTTGNVTHPETGGQTAWIGVPGRVVAPAAPAQPTTTSSTNSLFWQWNCPRDGGRRVTHFSFQSRRRGTSNWSASTTVVGSAYEQTGLTAGVTYEARVRAHTSFDVSPWSATGTGAPVAARPGEIFGLVAFSGEDAEVPCQWNEPVAGGATISRYDIQWRTASGSFSGSSQRSTTLLTANIGGLTNGSLYYFRVRAVNGVGTGAWSEEESATPVEPPPPPPVIPPDIQPQQVPAAPTATAITGAVLWKWGPPADGGVRITRFDVQVRASGDGWPSTSRTTTSSCFAQTGAVAGTTYQIRVRAVNAEGNGGWSATGSYAA